MKHPLLCYIISQAGRNEFYPGFLIPPHSTGDASPALGHWNGHVPVFFNQQNYRTPLAPTPGGHDHEREETDYLRSRDEEVRPIVDRKQPAPRMLFEFQIENVL